MIVDLESLNLDVISQVVRAYPDAQIIAICGAYREADCIAVLDMSADYLPRPFRALDSVGARASCRAAAIQSKRAPALLPPRVVRRRPVRSEGRRGRRAARASIFRIGDPDSSCAQRSECGDVRSDPRSIGARRLAGRSPSLAPRHPSSATQNRARPAATRPAANRSRGRLPTRRCNGRSVVFRHPHDSERRIGRPYAMTVRPAVSVRWVSA